MRVLLVEDKEKVSRFVALGLNAEQFVVDCAKDGITGYEMSTERPYDVLIIDLMLPRLSAGIGNWRKGHKLPRNR
jgi:DNA-binding response OmpR family regulator